MADGLKEQQSQSTSPRAARPAPPVSVGDYCFSLSSDLWVPDPSPTRAGPFGYRFHVLYKEGDVTMTEGRSVPLGWTGLKGKLLSGADFLLVRSDGVLALDGRVTLRSDDKVLIDALYTGSVDLIELLDEPYLLERGRRLDENGPESKSEAYRALDADFQRDFLRSLVPIHEKYVVVDSRATCIRIPLRVEMRFETASGPYPDAPGEDMSWIKKRYLKHQESFFKYRLLVRRQFVGVGHLTCAYALGTPPLARSIGFDVFELGVAPR
ncbi:MAG TPA: DUF3237 family protein [Polyangiaceae bacterium]|nr:DUF3237 family protein [Polyangiaceae bacterium]